MFSLILLVFLFLLSSFFASAETALASVNQVRLKNLLTKEEEEVIQLFILLNPKISINHFLQF